MFGSNPNTLGKTGCNNHPEVFWVEWSHSVGIPNITSQMVEKGYVVKKQPDVFQCNLVIISYQTNLFWHKAFRNWCRCQQVVFFVCLSRIQTLPTIPLSGNMKYFEVSLWNSYLSPFFHLFFLSCVFHVNSSNLKTFLDLFLRPLISWNRWVFVAWSRSRSNGWSLVAEQPGWKTIKLTLLLINT